MTSIVGITDAYLMKPTPKLNKYNNIEPKIINHIEMGAHCSKSASKLACQLYTTTVGLFEFPTLYYPDLLKVMVDGKNASYSPTQFGDYYLVGLKLNPGT